MTCFRALVRWHQQQENRPEKAGLMGTSKAPKDADTEALERRLSDALGLKVSINHKANGKGRVTIDYKSLDQLDLLEGKLSS